MKTNTETRAKKYQENVLIPKINSGLKTLIKDIDIFLEMECKFGHGLGIKTKEKVRENLLALILEQVKQVTDKY